MVYHVVNQLELFTRFVPVLLTVPGHKIRGNCFGSWKSCKKRIFWVNFAVIGAKHEDPVLGSSPTDSGLGGVYLNHRQLSDNHKVSYIDTRSLKIRCCCSLLHHSCTNTFINHI